MVNPWIMEPSGIQFLTRYITHMEFAIALDLTLILLLVTYGIVKMVELIRMKLIMSFLASIVVGEKPWVWPCLDLILKWIYTIMREKANIAILNLYGNKLLLQPVSYTHLRAHETPEQ